MAKRKSKKKIIIWSIVGVVVVLGVLGYFRWRSNLAAASKTTYDIVNVQKGTIEVKVKGAGTVEPLDEEKSYAGVSATVADVLFENGDAVKKGDVVAELESDELESQRDSLQQQIDDIDASTATLHSVSGSEYIYAPVEGALMAVYASTGDFADVAAQQYGSLAVICPDGLLEAEAAGAAQVSVGQNVTVTIGAKSVSGAVSEVSGGAFTVRFRNDGFTLSDKAAITSNGAALGEGAMRVVNPVYVTGNSGEIEKIYEKAGSKVSRGDKLFRLDGDVLSGALYDQIEQRKDLQDDLDDVLSDLAGLRVTAGTDGVITGLNLNPGQVVQSGAALFTVQSDKEMKIEVDIDELDIAGIEVGEEASVTFDALPGASYTAKVSKINPVGVPDNNVTSYTVTLSLSGAQGVMLGMSADVEIVSDVAQDVLIIPIEAIQTVEEQKYVILEGDLDPNAKQMMATHPVVTGITDGVNIEIKEGLSEGDRVAVPQVKELSVQQQMMNFRNNNQAKQSDNTQKSATKSATKSEAKQGND